MLLDMRKIVVAVGLCVAASLVVSSVSPGLFAVDRASYNDLTFGLGLIAVGLCLLGMLLVSAPGRETARRYYGGPIVVGVVLAGLVVAGGYVVVYGRAGLQGLLGI
jgi:hypothetical protein